MPQVIKLTDQNILVPTKNFPPYAHFPFENFNPVQSRVMDFFDKDANAVIAAATSAGKTICAEMIAAHEIRVKGKKVVYLAPLKALANEKIEDWSAPQHMFHDLKLSICTGDYRLTPDRKKELEEASIIVMTNEMMASRCRNYKSENNEWMKEIGLVVVDEVHLLSLDNRGDDAEVAIMSCCKIIPDAKLVFLSATMPNNDEIAGWITELTNRDTRLISSVFRPCPLQIHYETYPSGGYYEATEMEKVNAAMNIVNDYPDDKFLIFAHTKRTGEMMKQALLDSKRQAEFHNADLGGEERRRLEKDFKSGKTSHIVATSTLAWGCNFPARRVIVLGVHRGMGLVEDMDIWQQFGRAGRAGYDTRGDAYLLLPKKDKEEHIERITNLKPIKSRLLDYVGDDERHYKILAFHLVSEIHHGTIKNAQDTHAWFERSLAHFQAQNLDDEIIDSTIELLVNYGAIKEENGVYKATAIGVVSSLFYYSPFDVADLKRNFKALFADGYADNDLVVSMCLGDTDSNRIGIVSNADRAEMGSYCKRVGSIFGKGEFSEAAMKAGFAYFSLMSGLNSGPMISFARNLAIDCPRLIMVLNAIDGMSAHWGEKEFFDSLQLRVSYGIRRELVPLCRIDEIGKIRAERLWAAGIRNAGDIVNNAGQLQGILNLSSERVAKIVESAKTLNLLT